MECGTTDKHKYIFFPILALVLKRSLANTDEKDQLNQHSCSIEVSDDVVGL